MKREQMKQRRQAKYGNKIPVRKVRRPKKLVEVKVQEHKDCHCIFCIEKITQNL